MLSKGAGTPGPSLSPLADKYQRQCGMLMRPTSRQAKGERGASEARAGLPPGCPLLSGTQPEPRMELNVSEFACLLWSSISPPPRPWQGSRGSLGVQRPPLAALHLRGSASWQPEPQTAGDKLWCVTLLLRGSVPAPRLVPKARCDHLSCGQGLLPGRWSNLPLSRLPPPPETLGRGPRARTQASRDEARERPRGAPGRSGFGAS